MSAEDHDKFSKNLKYLEETELKSYKHNIMSFEHNSLHHSKKQRIQSIE